MSDYGLRDFIRDCADRAGEAASPADAVAAIAPLMHRLIDGDRGFLEPAHFRSDPDQYARNLVHADDASGLSLYSLVWLPGQWTPVHDHGTWGVVGVVEGQLEEQAYMRVDPDQEPDRHDRIDLRRAGLVLLSPGSISTFVPNPDHIHQTGCAAHRQRCVSLHLYGRMMSAFYSYDVPAGTRSLIEAAHNDTR